MSIISIKKYSIILAITLLMQGQELIAGGDYDFNNLQSASQVISDSFLPDDIKKWFLEIGKVYDRQAIKDSIDQDGPLEFLKKTYTSILPTNAICLSSIDAITNLELRRYQPYFDRLEQEIEKKGRYAKNLFDGFFITFRVLENFISKYTTIPRKT